MTKDEEISLAQLTRAVLKVMSTLPLPPLGNLGMSDLVDFEVKSEENV
jgi:hypothetical protein